MVKVKQESLGVQQGKQYGRWTVIGPPFSAGAGWRFRVVAQCSCGAIHAVDCINLAHDKSDACASCANTGQHMRHGDTRRGRRNPLYQVWNGMWQRCTNANLEAFKDYGGRGITVCDEWRDYEVFKAWALANGYARGKQIDRFPDNDAGYSPTNCRFVACVQNQRNRRSNRVVAAFGESKCLAEWADDARCKVTYTTLRNRIAKGWQAERAITQGAVSE